MTTNNSTALKQDDSLPISYSDFACDFSYQLLRVKAMTAGARALVYEEEELLSKHKAIMDAAYLLDDIVERIEQLASKVSSTEFDYQIKVN